MFVRFRTTLNAFTIHRIESNFTKYPIYLKDYSVEIELNRFDSFVNELCSQKAACCENKQLQFLMHGQNKA